MAAMNLSRSRSGNREPVGACAVLDAKPDTPGPGAAEIAWEVLTLIVPGGHRSIAASTSRAVPNRKSPSNFFNLPSHFSRLL